MRCEDIENKGRPIGYAPQSPVIIQKATPRFTEFAAACMAQRQPPATAMRLLHPPSRPIRLQWRRKRPQPRCKSLKGTTAPAKESILITVYFYRLFTSIQENW